MPITTYTPQTAYHTGSVYGGGSIATYSGTTTYYQTQTTNVPYHIDRYEMFATYWTKRQRPPILGALC